MIPHLPCPLCLKSPKLKPAGHDLQEAVQLVIDEVMFSFWMDSFKFRIFQLPVTSVEIWDIVRWNLAGWQKSNFAAICEMPGRADDSLGDGVEAVAGWGWLVVRLDHLQWWLLRQSPQTLYVYTPLYIYIYIYIYRYLIDCIFGIDQESSILLSQIGCHTRPPFFNKHGEYSRDFSAH